MGHFPQQTRKKYWKVPETVSLTVWPCASASENYCLTEIPGAGSRPEKNNPWTVPIDVVIAWIMMDHDGMGTILIQNSRFHGIGFRERTCREEKVRFSSPTYENS